MYGFCAVVVMDSRTTDQQGDTDCVQTSFDSNKNQSFSNPFSRYLCGIMHYASIENISKSFGIRVLFKDINFYIEEGDKIALVARNGTGKSTLLKIIAGLDTPDSGTIWVHKEVKVIMLQQETPFYNTPKRFNRRKPRIAEANAEHHSPIQTNGVQR